MPGVRVGRHARISAIIIDRDLLIPRGARSSATTPKKIVGATPSPKTAWWSSPPTMTRSSRRSAKRLSATKPKPIAAAEEPDRENHSSARPRDSRFARQSKSVQVDITVDGGVTAAQRFRQALHRRTRSKPEPRATGEAVIFGKGVPARLSPT